MEFRLVCPVLVLVTVTEYTPAAFTVVELPAVPTMSSPALSLFTCTL